jgi:UDPglucose--hexose-1-phosphate uridylyltransferase
VFVGELRKDYILDRWVIIAAKRGKRPHEFKTESAPAAAQTDYFAPGNETFTPPEIGRIAAGKGWKMRWFENKFAALQPEGEPNVRMDNDFFTFAGNYGHHEIIVETPDQRQLWDLSVEELAMVLGVYRDRINSLSKEPNIKYVQILKNHGPAGGTSIIHSHTQVMATAVMPPRVLEEIAAVRKFVNNPYERIIAVESKSLRRVFENDAAVAFCPYASRFNFEAWVFPKRFCRTLDEVGDLRPIAEALQRILVKLRELNCSFNIVLHYAPKGSDLHLHFEVLPRIAIWAGFEFGTDIIINSEPPEDAAAFYRGEA